MSWKTLVQTKENPGEPDAPKKTRGGETGETNKKLLGERAQPSFEKNGLRFNQTHQIPTKHSVVHLSGDQCGGFRSTSSSGNLPGPVSIAVVNAMPQCVFK